MMARDSSGSRTVAVEADGCTSCGTPRGEREESVLGEVARAELRLGALLIDLPGYARRFWALLRAPRVGFRGLDYTGQDSLRRSLAFLLQGITLAFLLLTLGKTLPQSIAVFTAKAIALGDVAQEELLTFAARTDQVKGVLPPDLATEWSRHAELMILT